MNNEKQSLLQKTNFPYHYAHNGSAQIKVFPRHPLKQTFVPSAPVNLAVYHCYRKQ